MSEFFSVRTVSEALSGFRPERRLAVDRVPVAAAVGLAAATDVRAEVSLPPHARSAVDGYAVAASATFGSSEGLPTYLDVAGAVTVGELPQLELAIGCVAEIPTGGVLPAGADAVVMVEHTHALGGGRIEVVRPAAAGENVIHPGDDVSAGATVVAGGHPLRPQHAGLLAALGIERIEVHRRAVVGIVSTGNEVVDIAVQPGGAQVRDANSHALAALVAELGGVPRQLGIVPDDPQDLERACRAALAEVDLLVISAGSSVGARDITAAVVANLGAPGIWCHGLALKPGKPTLLAEAGGRPIIGLPGNPVSALVVMRLLGGPVLRLIAGYTHPPVAARRQATLTRNVPSATGRFDVVQVRLAEGGAVPLLGKASQLVLMTEADGWITIPEPVQGLAAGSEVDVECYR